MPRSPCMQQVPARVTWTQPPPPLPACTLCVPPSAAPAPPPTPWPPLPSANVPRWRARKSWTGRRGRRCRPAGGSRRGTTAARRPSRRCAWGRRWRTTKVGGGEGGEDGVRAWPSSRGAGPMHLAGLLCAAARSPPAACPACRPPALARPAQTGWPRRGRVRALALSGTTTTAC